MMQPTKKPVNWRQALRRATPPALTVLASAIILSGAVWIHSKQTPVTISTSLGAGTAMGSSDGNDTIPHGHPGQSAGNQAADGSQPQLPGTPTKQNNSGSQPPSAQPTPAESGDIGFGPISGGTVKPLSDAPLSGGSQAACVVTQYGAAPQTSFGDRGLATPTGSDLPLPSGVSSHSLLALSLPSGVLWAMIPPTSMDSVGRPAASDGPTTLYYTPYTTNPASTLATGAITLGQLPVAVPASTSASSPGWYHPVFSRSNSGSSTTSVDHQPSETNTSTGTAQNITTPLSSASSNHLFLQGFYQTSVGAVIALAVSDATGTNATWLYLWNEQDKTLKPIANLPNNHDSFSWYAVGQDVVYWENRHLLPPNDVNYQGEQTVMNVHTLAMTRIHLGTWASQAIAFGNSLEFQVGQSVQWKQFDPVPSIAPAN